MKKLTSIILTLIISFSTLLIACSKSSDILVYAPDGAPALALTSFIKKGYKNTKINIVSADKIASVITGNDKKADVCILPINVASKLIGSGEDYKLIGTITHGNFYFLSSAEISLTTENLSVLIGKTIGVLQLQNVPGLVLQSVLNSNNLEYQIIKDNSQKDLNKVNLMAINKVETARTDIDVFLIPSPIADAKALTTNLKFIGSLAKIYGGYGFPQAVVVAKNSLIKNDLAFIENFVSELKNANTFLVEENKGEILTLLNSKIESGLTPTFNEKNLNADSIKRSNINFISIKDCKNDVENFILKLKEIQPSSVNEFNENCYYLGVK